MQLVKNGPYLPAPLLTALEEDELVFFCGAGISMPALPDFRALVEKARRELLPGQEPDEGRDYERQLYRIERKTVPGAMRRKVAELLATPPAPDTLLHEAILRLSCGSGKAPRLVTTNFDGLFEAAARKLGIAPACDAAPRLPRPDRHFWRAITHLHGRIGDGTALHELVLTSADYGRAYLADGFAARFLVELFRNFKVVFVGYSADDPPMRYLLDALAAERMRETDAVARKEASEPPRIWAFAGHHPDDDGPLRGWEDRGVAPIAFPLGAKARAPDYSGLRRTLIGLAELRAAGLTGKQRVVRDAAGQAAPQKQDPIVQQAIHFLREPASAEAFAAADPPAAGWLPLLAETTLCDALAGSPPAPPRGGAERHLADWLARQLPAIEVLDWIIARGGVVGPELAEAIAGRLDSERTLPDGVRRVFALLLEARRGGAPPGHANAFFASRVATAAEHVEALIAAYEPVVVLGSAAPWRAFAQQRGSVPAEPRPLSWFLDAEIWPRAGDAVYALGQILQQPGFRDAVVAAAHRLSSQLEAAAVLHALAERDEWLHWGAIADAGGKCESDRPWRSLVGLLRDAAIAAPPPLAESLVLRWQVNTAPVFQKLAAFVLARRDDLPGARLFAFLLEPGRRGGTALESELEDLLAAAWRRGTKAERRDLLAALQRALAATNVDGDWYVFCCLKWIEKAAGADLPADVQGVIAGLARRYESEGVSAARIEAPPVVFRRPFGDSDGLPEDFKDLPPAAVVALLQKNPARGVALDLFLQDHPEDAGRLAAFLQGAGDWSGEAWRALLSALADSRAAAVPAVRRAVLGVLAGAPDALLAAHTWTVGAFVRRCWAEADTPPDAGECRFWKRALEAAHDAAAAALAQQQPGEPGRTATDRAYNHAINQGAGMLAEAVLVRLGRRRLRVGQGIPQPERRLLRRLCCGTGAAHRIGRTALARATRWLFARDPGWTQRHLLTHFNEEHPASGEMWCGFLDGSDISADLFAALRPCYLAIPRGPAGLTHPRLLENFYRLAVRAAVRMPGVLDDADARTFLREAGAPGLVFVASALASECHELDADQGAALWRSRLLPWLQAVWPKERALQSEAATEWLACAVLSAGAAMPEAAAFVRATGVHLNRPRQLLRRLATGGTPTPAGPPDSVLALLDLIRGLGSPLEAGALDRALEALAAAEPALRGDSRWQRLKTLAANTMAGG